MKANTKLGFISASDSLFNLKVYCDCLTVISNLHTCAVEGVYYI